MNAPAPSVVFISVTVPVASGPAWGRAEHPPKYPRQAKPKRPDWSEQTAIPRVDRDALRRAAEEMRSNYARQFDALRAAGAVLRAA